MKKGKRILLAVILSLAVVFSITGCQSGGSKSIDGCEYEVILPENYDDSKENYPVIYVLPQDGMTMDDSGLAEKLVTAMNESIGTQMIIVKPSFAEDTDVAEMLTTLAEEVDKSYRTIPEQECRALVGTGVGGYLAYAIGLNYEGTFSSLVSARGDFVSEENPWYGTYGDVYDKIESMQDFHMNFFDENYTYLDAPADDEWTNMEGSTNDIGAWFIKMGVGSAAHEFTVRSGEFTEEFLQESANRIVDCLTTFMASSGVEGTENLVEVSEEETALEPVLVTKDAAEVDGDYQKLDLSGSWYFEYKGVNMIQNVAELKAEKYQEWSVVEAGTSNWTKGYGNISDENVDASYGEDYFDYFITGNAYYVKEFELPEWFNAKEMVLSVGYVDDRCEAYINGVCVGRTGMDEKLSLPTGDTTWAEYSIFEFDSSILKYDDINTVVIRTYNDGPYGAGGWYEGPIYLASKATEEGTGQRENEDPYFYEETFTSSYAASATGQEGTIENPYLIYLPKDYYETEDSYPTLYLLHQFNSDHTSYKTDNINEVLDEAIASGKLEGMIVVIPNSQEESWWTGDWAKMITDELIPHIDAKYRTLCDAKYRMTAGCSMGGQGAFSIALNNPEYFSGAVSFFGAFSMPPSKADDVLEIAENQSKEYLENFALYFSCGNQDVYGFGEPAIELSQILTSKGVEHEFFIENGGHDSAFYVPYFVEALAYVQNQMY